VKFIFATTEVHKVPITILSRCQRYDFKLIATQAIARRLEQVLSAEGIEADRGAVQVLAREAAGSMRDAMSLLDQVIAFSGVTLSASDVVTVLGVPDRKVLHDLASALVGGRPAECLQIIERVAQQGLDLGHVAKDILAHLRNLVVAKVCGAGSNETASLRDLLDLADEEVRDIVSLAAVADVDDLSRCFQGFSRAYDEIARSGQPRMALEMALVRLARRPPLLAIDELLSRVAELERRIEGSSAPAARGGGGGAGAGRGVAQLTTVSAGLPTTVEPPFGRTHGALALAPSSPSLAVAEPQSRPVEGASPLVVTLPRSPSSDPDAWRSIIERVRALRPPVASIYEMAVPVEVTAARITLAFEPSAGFLAARAAEPEALEAITQAVHAHFGRATVVVLQPTAAPAGSVKSLAQVNAENRLADRDKARARVEDHPLVRAAIRLLDAEVRDVRLPTESE
jgi:DNA polymerase III gamma/tau subunit